MPNLDPWINQQNEEEQEPTTPSKFEDILLSIRDEHKKRIGPKHHPATAIPIAKAPTIPSIPVFLFYHFIRTILSSNVLN